MADGPKWGRVCSLAKIGDKFMPSPHRDHRHHRHQSHRQYHHHHRSSIIFNIMVSLATSLCVSQRPRQPRTGSSKENGSFEKNIQLLTFMNTLSAVVQQDPFESPRKRVVNDINHRKLRRPAFYKNSVYQKTSEFPPWRRYPTRDASQAETVRGNALMCLWLSPRRPQATGISYFLDCIVLYFCISVLYLWSCLRWAGGTGKSYLLCIVEPDLWGHGNIVAWCAAQEISNCLWLSTIPKISQIIPTISQIIIIFKTSSAFSLPVALVDFFIVRVVNRIKYWALGRLQKFINNCHRILFLGWTIVKKKVSALLPWSNSVTWRDN